MGNSHRFFAALLLTLVTPGTSDPTLGGISGTILGALQ